MWVNIIYVDWLMQKIIFLISENGGDNGLEYDRIVKDKKL